MAPASFLELSVEVRLTIYAYLFYGFALHLDHNEDVRAHEDSDVNFVNAICRTSRLIRAESIPVLAQQCKIIYVLRACYSTDERHVGTKLKNVRQSFSDNNQVWFCDHQSLAPPRLVLPNFEMFCLRSSRLDLQE